ncbi:NAD-dependent epimerase/dehydratase family protein [Nocardioides mangrovicus]|uniref:NAD-dependent epimerase/dehydratase family protein n=1 Tax=Nocardioides mangrovicus TaxID=2478913 RepID=A0A3L8NYZ4_9ACTN|nr:NAD-dependent epimerase/dehydratase family protein [Nocardioides mangrovicus]RLV47872.1 NAD-dependent epimerase/dehydratase family protein [Nocardioides mangrovicus]
MTVDAPLTWVVGAGGLLGSHVITALSRRARLWTPGCSVPWGTADAPRLLARLAADFADAVGEGPWQVSWCAGAGVTGTTAAALAAESAAFEAWSRALTERLGDRAEAGAGFVASSAGAVYAGSRSAPFDEASVVRPISDYGHAKLAVEAAAARLSEAGIPVVVGRVANLYGPGQDLAKAQGLVSQICRAHLLARPLTVYVPLDTVRDYLFAADAGALVADCLERVRRERGHRTKIIASHQPVTVGHLVAEVRRVVKRRPRVTFGAHPNATLQARDLRVRSIVWPDLDRRPITPLAVGIARTVQAQTGALAAGALA